MSVQYIANGESTIEAFVDGNGESVVLLPGMGVDASMFRDLSPKLNNAGYQTIAVNARGIAGSKGPLEGATLHDLAADVAAVIRDLGVAPSHVLGAATGNRVARCVAEDFPELVKTVILLGAGGMSEPDPHAAAALRKMLQPDISEADRLECARIALYSPASDIEKLGLPSKPWPVVFQHAQVYLTTPLREWWGAGTAPMLVIQGLDDRIAPPENGRKLANEYGERVQLAEIGDAGHMLFVEKPDAVSDIVISYLSSGRTRA